MTTTTTWICPLSESEATGIQTRKETRGSHCRTSKQLFTEWAARLGFPDYFGHNWDAFQDCLADAVSNAGTTTPDNPPPLAVVVREAGDLLADDSPDTLAVLLSILSALAGDDSTAPRLLLLLEDTPERLSRLAQRLEDVGYAPMSSRRE
ncbi:barstar family protein [Streptomyces scabiei]|uniref:barstar family protein n=1 Tax=Streptomyces scabiei TaxID=1930 RepID=UPI0029A6A807|nr:barstar family protein [Streptomyces scabiei]MDX3517916.1 barstar family protein [Streptomyces scabiei]